MQGLEKFKSGADPRYLGCKLIRSSMVVTPARRDVDFKLGVTGLTYATN